MPQNVCSAGCATPGAHATYAECLRAKRLSTQWLGGTGPSYGDQKKWALDNAVYRQAVKDGASLSTAMNQGVDKAYREIGKG